MSKADKSMGKFRPRDARRVDPAPPRALSKAKPAKVAKNFGISIEQQAWRTKEWERVPWSWHETAKQRDQALDALRRKAASWWGNYFRDPQPIDRATYSAGGGRDGAE